MKHTNNKSVLISGHPNSAASFNSDVSSEEVAAMYVIHQEVVSA